MSQPRMFGKAANETPMSVAAFFLSIDDYLKARKEEGRLLWVDETKWSSDFATVKANPNNFEATLDTIGHIIWSAYERNCYDVLRFLFDTLADTVREDGMWRPLFGKHSIVDRCLDCIQADEEHHSQEPEDWIRSALRLLTNCCGDPEEDGSADDNQARVVAKLPVSTVINIIGTSTKRMEAVSLIYNLGLCNEHLRTLAVSDGLVSHLWSALEDLSKGEQIDVRFFSPICEMLLWAPEAPFDQEAFTVLSSLLRHDLSSDDVECLIAIAVVALKQKGLPQEQYTFHDLLDFLFSTCHRPQGRDNRIPVRDPEERFLGEDEEAVVKSREILIVEMSLLSARPHPALHWPVNCAPVKAMLGLIQASHFQLRICAFTMLANLANQSEMLSTALLEETSLCDRLSGSIRSESNGLVLKTGLGAVQRFAKTLPHRTAFARSGILEIIAPSWVQAANLPLQEVALSTTRHLLIGSLLNIDLFMSGPPVPEKSLFQLLFDSLHRSEVSESRSDIAWTLERIWRSIYSHPEVREMYEDKDLHSKDAIVTTLLHERIPRIYLDCPQILNSFLVILTSDNQDRIIAATYTLTIMLNEERDYAAIYTTLCQGEGRDALLALVGDTANPKAQLNSQALIQKLRSHYADDTTRVTNLTGLLQASRPDTTNDLPMVA